MGNAVIFWVQGRRNSLGSGWDNGGSCSSPNSSLSPGFGFSTSTEGNGDKC